MSDVINNPVAGNSKTTPTVKDANNTWKLLLGLFALLTVACLIWLVNSLSSVSQYLTN